MFRADSLEDLLVFVAVKAIHWIAAKDIYTVCPCHLVPKLFESNRRFRHASRPEARCTFSTSRNATMFLIYRFGRFGNEIVGDFRKANRVRDIVHHEGRERLCNTQRDIPALFNGGRNIHTMCLQYLKKTNAVGLRHYDDCRISSLKSGFNETTEALEKAPIIRIE